MAISYPVEAPTTIGIEQITFRTKNATATTESPFTFDQQTFKHPGERWEVDVVIPSVRKDLTQSWVGMLTSLRGQLGTFLLANPDQQEPLGTATTLLVSGNAGDETVSATTNGTLKAGDMFQIATGSATRLHMVLQDFSGPTGALEIWPALRGNYSLNSGDLFNPKGQFRLATPLTEWSINNSSAYGISFTAVEAL